MTDLCVRTARFAIPLLLLSLAALAGCARQSDPDPELVRRGNFEAPATLDPALADSVHEFNVLIDLYEGLIAEDAAGRPVPGVASTWQIADDGHSYTFTLRDDARWSDGSAVVADDFVRAWRRLADPDLPSAYAALLHPIRNFARARRGQIDVTEIGVTAVDPRTLRVELERPTAHLLALLALPVSFPLHPAALQDGHLEQAGRLVSNGAFRLAERAPGRPVRLERNAYFHAADDVGIDAVEFVAVADEVTEMQMYLADELDITGAIPPAQLDQLRTARPREVRVAPMLAVYYLAFDLTEPPLDRPELRAALSLAIDREALVRLLGRGEAPAYGLVPPGMAGYASVTADASQRAASARQARARELLAAAGYGPERPLQLGLMYDTGSIHEKVALAVSAMWQSVLGIDVRLDKREWQYFLATREQRDEWQSMRFSWFGDYNDASTFTDIFASDSPQNLPRYRNPRYDALLDAAATTLDPRRRAQLLREAETLLLADHPIAPLYFYVSKHLVKPGLDGFENNVLDRHPSRYLRWTEQ